MQLASEVSRKSRVEVPNNPEVSQHNFGICLKISDVSENFRGVGWPQKSRTFKMLGKSRPECTKTAGPKVPG